MNVLQMSFAGANGHPGFNRGIRNKRRSFLDLRQSGRAEVDLARTARAGGYGQVDNVELMSGSAETESK
jgi:hypothetical protein